MVVREDLKWITYGPSQHHYAISTHRRGTVETWDIRKEGRYWWKKWVVYYERSVISYEGSRTIINVAFTRKHKTFKTLDDAMGYCEVMQAMARNGLDLAELGERVE